MAFLGFSRSTTSLLQHPSVIQLHRGGGATWNLFRSMRSRRPAKPERGGASPWLNVSRPACSL
jgi:hypothetical protein